MKEKTIDLIPKLLFTLGTVVIVVCVLALIYISGLMIDWKNDHNVCKAEIKEWVSETDHHIRCYANDDASHYNFGKEVLCSCFWNDRNLQIKNKDFLSGTLK